jgi:hypothetical protein
MIDPLKLLPNPRNISPPNNGNDPLMKPLMMARGALADAAYIVYASAM